MRCAGENKADKCGSFSKAGCDPSSQSCAFPQDEHFPQDGADAACSSADLCSCDLYGVAAVEDVPAVSCDIGKSLLSDSQRIFFGELVKGPLLPKAPDLPDSGEIIGSIAAELRAAYTSVEDLVRGSHGSGSLSLAAQDAVPEGGGKAGAGSVDYTKTVKRGIRDIEALELFVSKPIKELASSSAKELDRMQAAVRNYSEAAVAVYGEGTGYGFNGSKVLEYYVNQVYEQKRAFDAVLPLEQEMIRELKKQMGPKLRWKKGMWERVGRYMEARCKKDPDLAREYSVVKALRKKYGDPGLSNIKLSGFNLGLNMTHINKLMGQAFGDAVKDEMGWRFNSEFGSRKLSIDGIPGTKFAASDVGKIKNMTFVGMDVGPDEAKRKGELVHREMLRFVLAQTKGAGGGISLPMAGHYESVEIDPSLVPSPKVRNGFVETRVLEFIGALHAGEDLASKANHGDGFFFHDYATPKARAQKAAQELYSMFNSPLPVELGKDLSKWGDLPAKPLHDGELKITQKLLKDGAILRESHEFGLELVHSKNVRELFDKLSDSIVRYQGSGSEKDFQAVIAARKAIRTYLRAPSRDFDAQRLAPSARLKTDSEKARRNFRFSRAGKSGAAAYKLTHMGEVATAGAMKAKPGVTVCVAGGDEFVMVASDGKNQWVIAGELHKFGDFNKAFKDGPKDPSFALLIEAFDVGLKQKIRGHSGSMTDAEMGEALKYVAGEVERIFKAREFTYSEKSPLPGGSWGGIQFGVKNGSVIFKQPKGWDSKAFKKAASGLAANREFRDAVLENFGVTPDGFRILPEEKFNKEGPISRRDLWELPDAGGKKRRLYVEPGFEVKGDGAVRPKTTLKAEFSATRMEDPRDFFTLIEDVLPEGIKRNKENGESVTMMKGASFKDKARGRLGHRVALSAGNFAFADIGAKLLAGTARYLATGDSSELEPGIVGETVESYAGMSAGAAVTDKAYRAGVELKSGELFKKTATGREFNSSALKKKYTGMKGGAGNLLAAAGAVAAMELLEKGRVSPVSLANSIAVMKGAQLITRAIAATAPFKSLKAASPASLLVEFLVMRGLSEAEAWALLQYEIHVRREALATAMGRYDESVEMMRKADGGRWSDQVRGRLEDSFAELESAFNSYSEILKISKAPEFKEVGRALELVEEQAEEVRRAEVMPTHPELSFVDMAIADPMPLSVGTKFMPKATKAEAAMLLQTKKDRLKALEVDYRRKLDAANAEFEKKVADVSTKISADELKIEYPSEEELFVASSVAQKASLKAIPGPAYMRGNRSIMPSDEYVSSEAIAKRTFKVRYWDKIKEDPYEATMQYLLFVKGRELYLESVTRK